MPGRLLKNASLRKQLLIPFITTTVIVGLVGAAVSYVHGSNMTKEALTQSTMAQLRHVNTNFETYFDDAQSVVRQFTGSGILSNPYKNEKQINESFQNVLNANTKYQALTFGLPDGYAIRAPIYFFGKGYDVTKENWYTLGAQYTGKSIWTSPYVDVLTKSNVVSVAQAVMSNGKVEGVVKLDLFIQSIMNQVKNTKFGDTGYAALLDSGGTYIASRNSNDLGKNASKQSFYKKIRKSGDSGFFYARMNGQNKLICYVTNQTTGWKLLGVIDPGEFSHEANMIALPSIVTVLVILAVAILLMFFLLKNVVGRLRSIQHAARRVEEGDLTVSLPVEGEDELADLTASINQMAKINREAFIRIKAVSHKITEASQTLVASSEENAASANEISSTVSEIAKGASSQTQAIDENQSALESLVDEIKRIDAKSKDVLHGADQMNETSRSGEGAVRNLHEQSRASAETTKRIVQAVAVLEKHAKNINQIIEVLDSIARRTNLLSLNASIEAAHAGEHGKGFAVVAAEIRKLAQQTNHSLNEVTETVNAMNEEMKHAAEWAKKTGQTVQDQEAAVNETNRAFNEIDRTISANVRGIQAIADAIRHTESHIEQINQGSRTIASTSEETAASTEEVSASVEEQTASMEELNRLAGDLDSQAKTLMEAIRRYTI
ncbi:methyl-accepting chemotaxis protein [Sporolactobacillus sp. THM7-7]|nr:methyl-accepting chemotaxis protein [Sporolactobacillus sp. THM7-7]